MINVLLVYYLGIYLGEIPGIATNHWLNSDLPVIDDSCVYKKILGDLLDSVQCTPTDQCLKLEVP